MSGFWRHCFERAIVFTAIRTAIVVGTILALINHFEAIATWSFTPMQELKIALTYVVPFSVATYAAAQHAQRAESRTATRARSEPEQEPGGKTTS